MSRENHILHFTKLEFEFRLSIVGSGFDLKDIAVGKYQKVEAPPISGALNG